MTGQESLIPKPVFENKTELVLGQTNVFLCEVSFTEGRFYSAEFARWSVDGVFLEKIHEQPFCTSREVRKLHNVQYMCLLTQTCFKLQNSVVTGESALQFLDFVSLQLYT